MKLSWALVGALLVAAPVLADVPGPKPVCNAPPECVGCFSRDDGCAANALDAGLVATDCRTGNANSFSFFCPPGVVPTQGCGCSGGAGASLFAAGAMMWLARRRRK